jgi:hypothetical protein
MAGVGILIVLSCNTIILIGIACWTALGGQARDKLGLIVKGTSRMQHDISVQY